MARASIYKIRKAVGGNKNRIYIKMRSLRGTFHIIKTPFTFDSDWALVDKKTKQRLQLFIERTFFSGSVEKHALKMPIKSFEFTGQYQDFNA